MQGTHNALLKCGEKCKQLKVLCTFNKQNIAKSVVVNCRTSAMLSPLAATIEKPTDNKDNKWERHYEEYELIKKLNRL